MIVRRNDVDEVTVDGFCGGGGWLTDTAMKVAEAMVTVAVAATTTADAMAEATAATMTSLWDKLKGMAE